MNTIVKITVTIALTLLGVSQANAQWGRNQVKGSGNITTTTVQTGDYDKISAVGSMDFILEKGTEGTISIKTDDNLHDLVIIENNGGTLTVKLKKNSSYKTKHGIIITIPFEDISEANLTGSGDLIGKDVVATNNFRTKLTGSGDVTLKVDASSVTAKVTGSGDMNLSGRANDLDANLIGSGDLVARSLIAQRTDVSVNGSGDASVTAKKEIKARVSGSGDIEYSGNPERRDTKVSGSGDISSN